MPKTQNSHRANRLILKNNNIIIAFTDVSLRIIHQNEDAIMTIIVTLLKMLDKRECSERKEGFGLA
jgi:hypothetical protein